MSTYNLLEHFQEVEDVKKAKDYDINPEAYNKNVFKDKKLNKLWTKAEMAGFNSTCLFLPYTFIARFYFAFIIFQKLNYKF